MNTTTLELGLRFAGILLTGLVVANFVAVKSLRYADNLKSAERLVRQIFYVHSGYIVGIIAALAILCLFWPTLLIDGSALSRALAGFFTVFWGSRVFIQLLYYDREVRRNERAWDVFFLGVFAILSTVFALATIYQ